MVWLLCVVVVGCTPYYGEPVLSAGSPVLGRAHWVARGETLWSISQRYGVSLEELIRSNRISDASRVEVGQRILIPGSHSSSRAPIGSRPPDSGQFIWPVQGRVIAIFGMRRGGRVNKGVDIQAPEGADVSAARAGRVTFVHEALPGFGKTIILEHEDGFASVYAYVGQILVGSGQTVAQRQVIARVGSTGRTEVPALHFEIRRNQKPHNPLYYLP